MKLNFLILMISLIILGGCTAVSIDDGVLRDENGTAVVTPSGLNVNLNDGEGNPIESFGGALDVHIEDVHKEVVNRNVAVFSGDRRSIAQNSAPAQKWLILNSTTGLSVDDTLMVFDTTYAETDHFHITAISGTNVTLDRGLDRSYNSSGFIEIVNINLADASSGADLFNPVTAKVCATNTEVWHIVRIMIKMEDNLDMDDSKWGGITGGLDNGIHSFQLHDGIRETISVWKTNGDMAEDMYDISYSSKAGQGLNGLFGRFSYNKPGFIVELNGTAGECMFFALHDDFNAVNNMNIRVQGHKVGH